MRRSAVLLLSLLHACRPSRGAPDARRAAPTVALSRAADATPSSRPSASAVSPARAPRPTWPLTATRLATARPTLHWRDEGAVRVELCRDRACRDLILRAAARGGALTVPEALHGNVFWRLVTDAPGVAPTAPWWFAVSAHPTDVGRVIGAHADVNGDGYGDALIGGALYLGSAEAPYLTPSPRPTPRGERLVAAGDVNGDGFGDLLVTTPRRGPIELYLGGEGGYAAQPCASIEAPARSASWGEVLVPLGDVNGDGYGDVAVGVPGRDVVYLYAGAATGIEARPAAEIHRWPRSRSSLGATVAALQDVNGDGYADLGVGTYEGDADLAVFYGAAVWPAASPAWTRGIPYWRGTVAALAPAGDLDGDGFADALRDEHENAPACRRCVWLRGGGSGVNDAAPESPVSGLRRQRERLSAEESDASALAQPAGDLDGDGFGDLLLLEQRDQVTTRTSLARGGPGGPGAAVRFEVVRAGEVAAPVGDVDRDGFDDLLLLRPGDGPQRLARGAPTGQPMRVSEVAARMGVYDRPPRTSSAP